MSQMISIPVKPPYPWESVLRYLALRSTTGLETVAASRYVRQTPWGSVSVAFDSSAQSLNCSAECSVGDLLERVQRLFDTTIRARSIERSARVHCFAPGSESCPASGCLVVGSRSSFAFA